MKVFVSWDSGPHGVYYRAGEVLQNDPNTVEIPDEVYLRYERAEAELMAAEDALNAAIQKARP